MECGARDSLSLHALQEGPYQRIPNQPLQGQDCYCGAYRPGNRRSFCRPYLQQPAWYRDNRKLSIQYPGRTILCTTSMDHLSRAGPYPPFRPVHIVPPSKAQGRHRSCHHLNPLSPLWNSGYDPLFPFQPVAQDYTATRAPDPRLYPCGKQAVPHHREGQGEG